MSDEEIWANQTTRMWCSNGYYECFHSGCQKKARPHTTDHDCCGHPKHDVTHAYWERDGSPFSKS